MNLKQLPVRFVLFCIVLSACKTEMNKASQSVKVSGAMRNVMWKGELQGAISLDTLNSENLYGLGPLEYLAGELLIIDGKVYVSTILNDSTMKVVQNQHVKASFFVYAQVPAWKAYSLPDSIVNIQHLEKFLNEITSNITRPFAFKLIGGVKEASIHIVNLPAGAKVNSPEKAHQGKQNYKIQNEHVEILGFFSTEHQGIFTHHDSFIHMHLITMDKLKMGHVDALQIAIGNMKLYLPAE